jgi:hypothetical protein
MRYACLEVWRSGGRDIPLISRDIKLCAQEVVVWIKRELLARGSFEVVSPDLCRLL